MPPNEGNFVGVQRKLYSGVFSATERQSREYGLFLIGQNGHKVTNMPVLRDLVFSIGQKETFFEISLYPIAFSPLV